MSNQIEVSKVFLVIIMIVMVAVASAVSAGVTMVMRAQEPKDNKGETGAIWLNGSGAPASTLGSNGDYYLDIASSDVFRKTLGTWTFTLNIKGAQGIQGLPGISGAVVNNIGSSFDIPTTARNLGNITVNAATGGFIFVIATADVVTFGDNTECIFGLGTTTGSFDLDRKSVGVLDGTGIQRSHFSLTATTLIPVEAGIHTYFVSAQKPPEFSAQYINMGSICAIAWFFGT
jgi:hypothetical protein